MKKKTRDDNDSWFRPGLAVSVKAEGLLVEQKKLFRLNHIMKQISFLVSSNTN